MGSLVTHVCSGVGGEVDVALELLCGLVSEKPSEMAMYAVFVKVAGSPKIVAANQICEASSVCGCLLIMFGCNES